MVNQTDSSGEKKKQEGSENKLLTKSKQGGGRS